jgi:hypothetical protein
MGTMSAPIATPWLSSQSDQDPRSATGKTLRWGVIATGGIARSVAQDLALLADAELYAVSSRGQDTADAFAVAYDFARAYGDGGGLRGYQRLLADDAVSARRPSPSTRARPPNSSTWPGAGNSS